MSRQHMLREREDAEETDSKPVCLPLPRSRSLEDIIREHVAAALSRLEKVPDEAVVDEMETLEEDWLEDDVEDLDLGAGHEVREMTDEVPELPDEADPKPDGEAPSDESSDVQ